MKRRRSQEIHATRGLEDYPVQTMDDWLSMMTPEKLPGFNIALDVVTGIAVIVGFLVIFQSMYTAVLERTREIGILKSMGASKPAIVSVVLRETAVMAAAGVLVGIAGTYRRTASCWATCSRPMHFEITGRWIVKGSADRVCGSAVRRALPGLDGRAQGSHRRAGLRIERRPRRS